MVLASSILTFAGLAGLGAGAAAVYLFLSRRQAGGTPPPGPAGAAPPVRLQDRVSVRAVVERLLAVGDHEMTFFDRDTRRFVTLSDKVLGLVQGNEPLDDHGDSARMDLKDVRRKLKSKVLLPLPTKAETKEFLLQERFCEELQEGEARQQMQRVMRGEPGFRSFDGAVKRLGLVARWHERRDAEFGRIAAAWLDRNGIAYDGTAGL